MKFLWRNHQVKDKKQGLMNLIFNFKYLFKWKTIQMWAKFSSVAIMQEAIGMCKCLVLLSSHSTINQYGELWKPPWGDHIIYGWINSTDILSTALTGIPCTNADTLKYFKVFNCNLFSSYCINSLNLQLFCSEINCHLTFYSCAVKHIYWFLYHQEMLVVVWCNIAFCTLPQCMIEKRLFRNTKLSGKV